MKSIFFPLVALGLAAACAQSVPLSAYRPVVDPASTDMNRFEADLAQCRAIAMQAEGELQQRQNAERGGNMLGGAVTGAVIGALIGTGSGNQGNLIKAGAAAGTVSGAFGGENDAAVVRKEPRLIVDRCMSGRGYKLLSSPGRG